MSNLPKLCKSTRSMSSNFIYLLFSLLVFCVIPYLFLEDESKVGQTGVKSPPNDVSFSDTITDIESDKRNYVSSGLQGKLRCLKSFEPTPTKFMPKLSNFSDCLFVMQ